MHVLVYGHTAAQHDALQGMARDIYQVAAYFEEHGLAHSVAHPIYRQNDKLERWHLERFAAGVQDVRVPQRRAQRPAP